MRSSVLARMGKKNLALWRCRITIDKRASLEQRVSDNKPTSLYLILSPTGAILVLQWDRKVKNSVYGRCNIFACDTNKNFGGQPFICLVFGRECSNNRVVYLKAGGWRSKKEE